jgi:hypothetical protein
LRREQAAQLDQHKAVLEIQHGMPPEALEFEDKHGLMQKFEELVKKHEESIAVFDIAISGNDELLRRGATLVARSKAVTNMASEMLRTAGRSRSPAGSQGGSGPSV